MELYIMLQINKLNGRDRKNIYRFREDRDETFVSNQDQQLSY